MLLDQFSRGLHLSPDILDVLIESHILTQLEFHNYTRIPTKTRTCSLQRGGDKKSFSLLFPFFFYLTLKSVRVKQCFFVCLFVCVLRTGALQLKLLSLSFLFFLTFHIKVGIGWPVGSGLKEEKKEKEKKEKEIKENKLFSLINMLQNSEGRGIRNTMLNFHAQYLRI